jgi:hypothetical protein
MSQIITSSPYKRKLEDEKRKPVIVKHKNKKRQLKAKAVGRNQKLQENFYRNLNLLKRMTGFAQFVMVHGKKQKLIGCSAFCAKHGFMMSSQKMM